MFAVASEELLYGRAHVVVCHHTRRPSQFPEAVAVRFHKGKRVLPREQISLSHVAVVKGKNRHVQTRADPSEPQRDHSPVKLAPEPRLIALADVRSCRLLCLFRNGLQSAYILTYRGIRYADALVLKATPHIELTHLLLVKPGRRILPVAGYEAVNPAPHLFGHNTPNSAAAVILRLCQEIVVYLP